MNKHQIIRAKPQVLYARWMWLQKQISHYQDTLDKYSNGKFANPKEYNEFKKASKNMILASSEMANIENEFSVRKAALENAD